MVTTYTLLIFIPTWKNPGLSLSLTVSDATNMLFYFEVSVRSIQVRDQLQTGTFFSPKWMYIWEDKPAK